MGTTPNSPQCEHSHPHCQDYFFRMFDRALAIRYTNEFLADPQRRRHLSSGGFLKPRIDILDDAEFPKITCLVEIPGIKKRDVSLHVQDGHLIITGVRRPPPANRESNEDRNSYAVKEVRYGRFRREVPLPADIRPNEIYASMSDGMLTVTWPRVAEAAEPPQRIEVVEE